MIKNKIYNVLLFSLSVLIAVIFLEFFLIIKSKLIINYDTEMWKYSKNLKIKSDNKKINHVHRKNTTSVLQNVEINLNSYGLRGNEKDLQDWKKSTNKILIIGSSITLGWGVDEKKIITTILNDLAIKNNLDWKFLNAGVGNYNIERYVNNYLENLKQLKPDKIIIQYFLNDAEILPNTEGNIFTRNFHLGVLLWKYKNLLSDDIKFKDIFNYYDEIYTNKRNLDMVENNMKILKEHCRINNKECIIVYTPDIQFINDKRFNIFSKKIESIAQKKNLNFIDLTDVFLVNKKKNLLNDYNDNHPNELGHKIMANKIFNSLQ